MIKFHRSEVSPSTLSSSLLRCYLEFKKFNFSLLFGWLSCSKVISIFILAAYYEDVTGKPTTVKATRFFWHIYQHLTLNQQSRCQDVERRMIGWWNIFDRNPSLLVVEVWKNLEASSCIKSIHIVIMYYLEDTSTLKPLKRVSARQQKEEKDFFPFISWLMRVFLLISFSFLFLRERAMGDKTESSWDPF